MTRYQKFIVYRFNIIIWRLINLIATLMIRFWPEQISLWAITCFWAVLSPICIKIHDATSGAPLKAVVSSHTYILTLIKPTNFHETQIMRNDTFVIVDKLFFRQLLRKSPTKFMPFQNRTKRIPFIVMQTEMCCRFCYYVIVICRFIVYFRNAPFQTYIYIICFFLNFSIRPLS